ncbi:MAG: ABC transporter ATP-binding protein [Flavobacteriales bacterium]|nr:ABC transporter ATP-binding protein [Flavobacteriales bacterium]
MIEIKGIEKAYGELKVLKGIDLEVREAEVISIVGSSGAGKSTLLHILGTLDRADKGTYFFNGTDLSKLNDAALAQFRNQHIGFVFQFHQLLPEFTALENVCMPAFIGKKDVKASQKSAQELLEFLGLSSRLTHKPSELSGGEQQRVAVARALMNEPGLILADEPSGNLDSTNARELHKLFFELRDQFKQTFIIVTHNEELANMADRKLVIKDGVFLA